MANFPASKDDATSLPNPTGTNTQNNPDHASLHTAENAAIIAVESKLGTGSSTPVANTLLFGTGTGTSAWTALTSSQLASVLSDETGTGAAVFATTPTLVTPKVDTINEATGGNGTTIGGVNIKSGALNTNNSVVTTNITDSAVTFAKVATGFVVQEVDTTFNAVATGITVVPNDDTIPQSTEGNQFMTQAITPKATTNKLVIEATMSGAASAAGWHVAALFQDATANALAASMQYGASPNGAVNLKLFHSMAAGTTSATTFKVRIGIDAAGTYTFNGAAGARLYGGTILNSITIREYKA